MVTDDVFSFGGGGRYFLSCRLETPNQLVLRILHTKNHHHVQLPHVQILLQCQTYCTCDRIFFTSNHTYTLLFRDKCIRNRQYISNRRYDTRLDAIKLGCSFLLSRQQLKYGSRTVALHNVSYWYYTLPEGISGLSATNINCGWCPCLKFVLSTWALQCKLDKNVNHRLLFCL